MKVMAVAGNTLREALRERLLYNLVAFGLLLILGSLTISQLTLGEQYRIIANIATGSTQLFGTLIAVFLGATLLARELDRRTCYAALARPVSRTGFLLGKYLGLLAALGLNVLVMAGVSAAMLFAYSGNLSFLGSAFFGAFGLLFVQFAVCGAYSVLFTSFSTPTLAVILTLSVVAAGHIFTAIRDFWLQSKMTGLKQLVGVFDYLLPNMGFLDLKEALTYGDPVGPGTIALRGLYGLSYAATVVAIAAMVFSRRDVR